jgi:prepilin-type N-terminal cleavage/methylation domain-containing protein
MRTNTTGDLGERGFSLIEVLVVLGITGVMAAMTMMIAPAFARSARPDAGTTQVLGILRSARALAVTERRDVELRFVGLDRIEIARVEVPGPATTVVSTMQLENRVQFAVQPGVPNTPDGFLPFGGSGVAFPASATRLVFTSEGSFVNQAGDPINGSIFLSIAGDKNSARAVTILGTTALMQAWRWDGAKWTE